MLCVSDEWAKTCCSFNMHRCLNVDEILRLLAHELVASEAKATAVALACCCKSLEDPLLDVLWETQNRLLRLLKSLPGDVWYEGTCTVSAQIPYSFSPYSTDWLASPSKDSRQRWSGLASGSTLEGCELSKNLEIQAPCPPKFSRFCNFAPSPPTNPCFRT